MRPHLGVRLWLLWRGASIVSLTAANVALIAGHHTGAAFVTSAAISVVWWGNSAAVSRVTIPDARWWYGLGAGLGTAVAMWLVQSPLVPGR